MITNIFGVAKLPSRIESLATNVASDLQFFFFTFWQKTRYYT